MATPSPPLSPLHPSSPINSMGKSKLGALLKKCMQSSNSGSNSKSQPANVPPLLPSPRPRLLTPDSTCGDRLDIDLDPQPETCAFFSKLAYDIRLMIIKKAFGDQKVHMNLTFDFPLLPPPDVPPSAHRRNHAGIYRQDDYRLSKVHDQPHGQKEWRWGGCVCHRNPPLRGAYKGADMMRSALHGLWEDQCMRGCSRGDGPFCDRYHGTKPEKCRIGAMGFLLSGRQAYVEGLEVLYGSNWIIAISQHLMLCLPQLILHYRLSSIAKMELRVQGYNIEWADDEYSGPEHFDLSNLGRILRHVETYCTNLRSLFLSLNVCTAIDGPEFINGPTLPIIDAFYLATELSDMIVEIPELLYEAAKHHACLPGPQHPLEPRNERPGENGHRVWVKVYKPTPWRCLESLDDKGRLALQIQMRPTGNYPRPPLQLLTPENADKRVPSRAYWIKNGRPYYRAMKTMNCGT